MWLLALSIWEHWLDDVGLIVTVLAGVSGALAGTYKFIKGLIVKTSERKTVAFKRMVDDANKEMIDRYELEHKVVVDELNVVKRSQVADLHDRIYQGGERIIQHGYVTPDELNNFEYLYRSYHDDLGGNGTGEVIYTRVQNLPLYSKGTNYVDEAKVLHEKRKENNK